MVPRPNVVSLPASMPLSELFSVTARGNHTRYLVHEDDSTDRIVGAVHIGDVMRAVEAEGSKAQVTARDLAREVLVVPENRAIDDLLKDLQRQKMEMAIVIDEWGSFEGVLTVGDILGEIVGEIRDEFDEEEGPTLHKLADGSYSVDGSAPLTEVNKALGSKFESEDFETIGGLVFGYLGRTPEVGDEVLFNGYALRVEEVDGPRVARLVVRERGEEDTAGE
jgi:CBS domain containing-hemolysin-like protein